MVEFYLLTFPRFPLRKKEHNSYFGKNRTHDFRTSRCAGYLLVHSGDEVIRKERTYDVPSILNKEKAEVVQKKISQNAASPNKEKRKKYTTALVYKSQADWRFKSQVKLQKLFGNSFAGRLSCLERGRNILYRDEIK